MVPQSARANPAQPVVGAGCFFAGVSGNTETFICSGAATPFIFSASTPPPDTRQIILANEFVTAAGVQVSAGNQNIIIDQVTVLGIVQQPVPDIVGGPNPGIGVQTFAVVNGDITVITSAANPNFGPAGNGLGNTATIFSDFAGIQTITFGTGNTSINANGNIVSGVFGIFSASAGGDISITNNGNIGFNGDTGVVVPIGGDGIFAITAGAGNITALNTGTINAGNNGFTGETFGTGSILALNTGIINAGQNGLVAIAFGNGAVETANTGTINATNTFGMFAFSNGGNALGFNSGAINSGFDGMQAVSGTGNALALNASTGIITAGGSGIAAISNAGNAFGQNDGIITAARDGIFVRVDSGTGSAAAINTGLIVAPNPSFNGMEVLNFGTGVAFGQNTSTGLIVSDAGMNIQSFNGGDVQAINNGTIVSSGPLGANDLVGEQNPNGVGIFVRSQGGAHNGNVQALNTGTIVSNGNGIFAQADELGNGTIAVVNTGTIVSTERNGIRARNDGGGGPIGVGNSGVIVSETEAAISVRNAGTAFTQIVNSGALRGAGADFATAVISIDNEGVAVNNTPTFITNTATGDIRANDGLASSFAIATTTFGSRVEIANAGVIVGRVDLTDGNDIFANAAGGVWSTASLNRFLGGDDLIANAGLIRTHGVTEFAMDGGANRVDNSGRIDVLNGGVTGTGTTGQVLFSRSAGGTLVFNNAGGIIDMSNDVGNRTTNTVVIQGNFNASGNSRLGVDSFLGPPGSTSDRLGVQGNVTGLTNIIVNDVNPGPGAFNPTGIAVVNITGAGNLSNFQLSSGSDHFNPAFGGVLDKGLFFYFLANDPAATSTGCNLLGAGNHCVSLYSLPSVTAQQLPIAITAAQTIFYETALMWEDRQTEVRDWWARGPLANIGGAGADMPVKARPPGAPPPPPPPRFGVWLKGMGSWADVDKNQTQSLAGQSFTFDLGYKQDTYAIVGGVDFGMPAFTDGVFVWGPMGGYVNSKVRFDQGGNTFKYTGGTVGLSASYLSGGFLGAGGWFADALVKADFLRLSVDTPLLASQGIDLGHVDVTTWGVIGNLGYRFNFGPAFFEPIGTLTYARVDIDNINNTLLGTNLNFGNGDSFRGAIGARLGTRFNWWAGHTNEAWILGRVWDEFAGNNNTVDLLNPGVPITVADDTFRHKAFGEVKAGLDFIAFGAGWSAHVNGGAKFGDDFTIWNAKGGVNYKW